MKKWSSQKFFDAALNHIRKQGAPALSIDGGCVNVAPDGKRCAIAGVFTVKSAEQFENDRLIQELVNHGVCEGLVQDVRNAHDQAAVKEHGFLQWFERNMRLAAIRHYLKYEAS